jgi:hypothetical protein
MDEQEGGFACHRLCCGFGNAKSRAYHTTAVQYAATIHGFLPWSIAFGMSPTTLAFMTNCSRNILTNYAERQVTTAARSLRF